MCSAEVMSKGRALFRESPNCSKRNWAFSRVVVALFSKIRSVGATPNRSMYLRMPMGLPDLSSGLSGMRLLPSEANTIFLMAPL